MHDRSASRETVCSTPSGRAENETIRNALREMLAVDEGVDGGQVGRTTSMQSDFVHDLPFFHNVVVLVVLKPACETHAIEDCSPTRENMCERGGKCPNMEGEEEPECAHAEAQDWRHNGIAEKCGDTKDGAVTAERQDEVRWTIACVPGVSMLYT